MQSNMNKDSSDKEILDYKIDENITIRDISAMTFLAWLAGKLNGVQAYSAAAQELRMAVSGSVYGTMPELEKVRLVRKLLTLDVSV